jgi:hypothetical protein
MVIYRTSYFNEVIEPELQGSRPETAEQLTSSYRGFPFRRLNQFYLWEIVPRENCDLPAALAGRYTKLATLKSQIDKYLSEDDATVDAAFKPRTQPPRRGRPRKVRVCPGTSSWIA